MKKSFYVALLFILVAILINACTSNIESELNEESENPPVGEIVSPTSGEVISGTYSFLTEVEDTANLRNVEYFLGGQSIGLVTEYPYELQWNSFNYSNGEYSLVVKLTNDDDGTDYSETIRIRVKNFLVDGYISSGYFKSNYTNNMVIATDTTGAVVGYTLWQPDEEFTLLKEAGVNARFSDNLDITVFSRTGDVVNAHTYCDIPVSTSFILDDKVSSETSKSESTFQLNNYQNISEFSVSSADNFFAAQTPADNYSVEYFNYTSELLFLAQQNDNSFVYNWVAKNAASVDFSQFLATTQITPNVPAGMVLTDYRVWGVLKDDIEGQWYRAGVLNGNNYYYTTNKFNNMISEMEITESSTGTVYKSFNAGDVISGVTQINADVTVTDDGELIEFEATGSFDELILQKHNGSNINWYIHTGSERTGIYYPELPEAVLTLYPDFHLSTLANTSAEFIDYNTAGSYNDIVSNVLNGGVYIYSIYNGYNSITKQY